MRDNWANSWVFSFDVYVELLTSNANGETKNKKMLRNRKKKWQLTLLRTFVLVENYEIDYSETVVWWGWLTPSSSVALVGKWINRSTGSSWRKEKEFFSLFPVPFAIHVGMPPHIFAFLDWWWVDVTNQPEVEILFHIFLRLSSSTGVTLFECSDFHLRTYLIYGDVINQQMRLLKFQIPNDTRWMLANCGGRCSEGELLMIEGGRVSHEHWPPITPSFVCCIAFWICTTMINQVHQLAS